MVMHDEYIISPPATMRYAIYQPNNVTEFIQISFLWMFQELMTSEDFKYG
jgi:hypothetical protein